jgi:transcriptional regulator with XRE-family HTH domain
MIRAPRATRSADRWFTVVDGVRLRQLRRQHRLSPAELAAKAGISLPTVIRLDQPLPSCRTRTAVRLATVLGQSAADLTCSQPSPSHALR